MSGSLTAGGPAEPGKASGSSGSTASDEPAGAAVTVGPAGPAGLGGSARQRLPARWVRAVAVDVGPLRTRAYRRLWSGQAVTLVGNQMTLVAVPAQVYGLTGRSFDVGLTSVVALVPLIVFGLLGGAITDTVNRRTLLLVTGSALAVVSAGLWAQALLPGDGNIFLLWALVAVQSALVAVNSPARGAVIPRLLPAEQVPAANALNQIVTNIGVVAGPLVAGVMLTRVGLAWIYLVDAGTFVVALGMLAGLPSLPPDRDGSTGRPSVLEGLRFLTSRRVLLMAFCVDINAMVFGWPRALFPELADTRFGGPGALGWLYAAPAIGALVAALLGGWLGRVHRQGLAVLVSVSLWGVAIGAFGFAGSLPLAVLFLAGAGAADMVSAVFRNSMLQVAAPDAMRGRLQGVYLVVVTGGPRLGDLRSGGMSALTSPAVSLVSGGAVCVLGVLLLAATVPAFARYHPPKPSHPPATGDVFT